MGEVIIHGKTFVPFLSPEEINARVAAIGAAINAEYAGQRPLLLGILNGSFIFAADLFRTLTIDADISFIKLASYKGTSSSGNVITAIGLEEELHDRQVIIVEDIVDTGRTLHSFLPVLKERMPASVKIAAFLTKPDALQCSIVTDYVGFEVPNDFVVGYGLDYDGLGRNLPGLFRLEE